MERGSLVPVGVAASFVVARLAIGSVAAAWLATLAFALTPKAHPIAVLWISARADLLMALFSWLAPEGPHDPGAQSASPACRLRASVSP